MGYSIKMIEWTFYYLWLFITSRIIKGVPPNDGTRYEGQKPKAIWVFALNIYYYGIVKVMVTVMLY